MTSSLTGGPKSKYAVWGTSSKCSVDVSLLNSLSNIALSFEGCTVPTVDSLKAFFINSESIQNELDDNQAYVDDYIDVGDDSAISANNGTKESSSISSIMPETSSTYSNANRRRETPSADSTEMDNMIRKVPVTSAIILTFFDSVKRHYGDGFSGVYESFADCLQRFLKAEISESAMVNILKSLLTDSSLVQDVNKIFKQTTTFETGSALSSSTTILPRNQTKKALGEPNEISTNETFSHQELSAMIRRNIESPFSPRKIDREKVKIFLDKVRHSVDESDYCDFMDSLIELRSLIKSRNPAALEKLAQVKSLIPRERTDLIYQFNNFFPVGDHLFPNGVQTDKQQSLPTGDTENPTNSSSMSDQPVGVSQIPIQDIPGSENFPKKARSENHSNQPTFSRFTDYRTVTISSNSIDNRSLQNFRNSDTNLGNVLLKTAQIIPIADDPNVHIRNDSIHPGQRTHAIPPIPNLDISKFGSMPYFGSNQFTNEFSGPRMLPAHLAFNARRVDGWEDLLVPGLQRLSEGESPQSGILAGNMISEEEKGNTGSELTDTTVLLGHKISE